MARNEWLKRWRLYVLWLDGNFAECFEQGGRDFVGVAHGGADVLVAHGLLNGIRIAVGRKLQCAVSVAEAVERDMLLDAG